MKIRRKSDGRIFNSVNDAVTAFKCPGPCDPDCALYDLVGKPGDKNYIVHKCHPDYVAAHPHDILKAIGCEEIPNDQKVVAVIKAAAVHGVQICRNTDHDLRDANAWYDLLDAEIFLGIFDAANALNDAAAYANTSPENIRLIPIETNDAG